MRRRSFTYATAPLVWPTSFVPTLTYPKYLPCASSESAKVSTFKTLLDWLYVDERFSDFAYGFILNVFDGELNDPSLWLPEANLKVITDSPSLYPITVSPTSNTPIDP